MIDAASCSKGAFSHYFDYVDFKEGLLLVFHDTLIDHLPEFAEAMAKEGGAPLVRFEAIFRHHLGSLSEFHDHMAVLHNEAASGRAGSSTSCRSSGTATRRPSAARRAAIAQGFLCADLDAKLFALALLGVFNGAFRWYRPDGPLPPQEMSHQLFTMRIGICAPR